MGVILFFLVLIAYLVAGLFISRAWWRRQRRPGDEEGMAALFTVFLWPAFLFCHYSGKAIRRFYVGAEDA